jgi:outer membrane protein assembly factor BamB
MHISIESGLLRNKRLEMISKRFLFFACLWLTLCTSVKYGLGKSGDSNWPSFRGHHANGVAEGYPTSQVWDMQKNDKVRWKASIPGLAHSSPIVWEESIFLTTSIGGDDKTLRVGLYGDIGPVEDDSVHRWIVYRVDKESGKIIWTQTAHRGAPKIKRHPKSTHANPTPATDGKHVVALFGSEGLYCYNFSGKLLWKKDLGVLDSGFFLVPGAQWGFASSPIIFDGKVFVQCDVQEGSFLAAFDIENGEEIWRTPRADVPTWCTPTIYAGERSSLLLVNGWKHVGGYDTATGNEIWKLSGGGDIPVPTPVVAHDLVFITNAHGPLSPIYAIRLDAKGDISLKNDATSNESVVWSIKRGGAYMQTPLVYGDYLYNCRDNGVLSCYRARTGDRLYQERLGKDAGGFSASPVATDGKLYFSSETGDIFVVRAGPEFELLAVNSFDETVMATPAISEGTLYFRTRSHLIAIGP